MNCALIVDPDFPGDVPADTPVMGRALAAYPLQAAQACKTLKRLYLVSDSPAVKAVALQYGAIIVDPPPGEERPDMAGRVAQGWRFMKDDLQGEEPLELVALLFTHAGALTVESLDEGIELMLADPKLDSAMTVTRAEFCEPRFAFRERPQDRPLPVASGGGTPAPETPGAVRLEPAFPPGAPAEPVWFPDLAVTVLRPRCLDSMRGGKALPWLGSAVAPLKRDGSTLVEHRWQLPQLEHWLKTNGVVDIAAAMEPQPQPQPMPRQDRR